MQMNQVAELLKVAVLDDHPIVLDGLSALLDDRHGMRVVGTYPTETALYKGMGRKPADVLILDLALQDQARDGISLIERVHQRYPELAIMIFSMCTNADIVKRALAAGARGYCVKGAEVNRLIEGVGKIASGTERFIGPGMEKDGGFLPFGLLSLSQLSTRELEVFERIGAGMKTSEIAQDLFVSVKTIESHRTNIKRKLNLSSSERLQATAAVHRYRAFEHSAA